MSEKNQLTVEFQPGCSEPDFRIENGGGEGATDEQILRKQVLKKDKDYPPTSKYLDDFHDD